jgi:hypothetical protein
MNVKKSLFVALALVLLVPSVALGKDKKLQRAMLESMQAVPCGARERGLTGLGSMVASLGVEHVNSHEQLCPQYLLRTDEMDYHIRPLDLKHAVVLPVGHEAEFKIKKDRMLLRIGDGKERAYQVVSMQPINSDANVESGAYHPIAPADSPLSNTGASTTGNTLANTTGNTTNQVTGRPPQP